MRPLLAVTVAVGGAAHSDLKLEKDAKNSLCSMNDQYQYEYRCRLKVFPFPDAV